MSVVKEFRCLDEECGRDFEGLLPVCPRCGSREVKRVFLTPVGINGGRKDRGSAKRIDGLLEDEFKRQGISNFTNRGGENKISWARRVNATFPGRYASSFSGAPAQVPISAFCGRPGDFSALERDESYGFRRNNLLEPLPFSGASHSTPQELMPTIDQGAAPGAVDMVDVARSTPLPQALAKRTTRIKR